MNENKFNIITDGKNNNSISWDSAGGISSSSQGQVLESLWHQHGLRVDEGEEENVGALLLVLVQLRLPLAVRVELFLVVVSKKKVESQYLNPASIH